eukprot:Hpha_TRINITY_DN12694_c0_g2::TRINITY_DN12694_c0_g2_i1::g.49444::m.49444
MSRRWMRRWASYRPMPSQEGEEIKFAQVDIRRSLYIAEPKHEQGYRAGRLNWAVAPSAAEAARVLPTVLSEWRDEHTFQHLDQWVLLNLDRVPQHQRGCSSPGVRASERLAAELGRLRSGGACFGPRTHKAVIAIFGRLRKRRRAEEWYNEAIKEVSGEDAVGCHAIMLAVFASAGDLDGIAEMWGKLKEMPDIPIAAYVSAVRGFGEAGQYAMARRTFAEATRRSVATQRLWIALITATPDEEEAWVVYRKAAGMHGENRQVTEALAFRCFTFGPEAGERAVDELVGSLGGEDQLSSGVWAGLIYAYDSNEHPEGVLRTAVRCLRALCALSPRGAERAARRAMEVGTMDPQNAVLADVLGVARESGERGALLLRNYEERRRLTWEDKKPSHLTKETHSRRRSHAPPEVIRQRSTTGPG